MPAKKKVFRDKIIMLMRHFFICLLFSAAKEELKDTFGDVWLQSSSDAAPVTKSHHSRQTLQGREEETMEFRERSDSEYSYESDEGEELPVL